MELPHTKGGHYNEKYKGTISRHNNDNIRRTRIPFTTLEEQERIVAILDRFDALNADISSGLPAEIIARQKQY